MLTPKEIDRLVQRIVERMRPQQVVIFGSYAKGTATIESDLDLLVIATLDLPMAKRADELKPMLSHTLIPVDVHIYTPEEVREYGSEPYSFINNILNSGKTVFRAPGPLDSSQIQHSSVEVSQGTLADKA